MEHKSIENMKKSESNVLVNGPRWHVENKIKIIKKVILEGSSRIAGLKQEELRYLKQN